MHKCARSGFSNSLFSVLLLITGCVVKSVVLSANVEQREECILGNVVYKFDIGTTQLLKLHGYPHESHFIKSEDGYIVEAQRIPAPGKPVVYLVPGIFQSSRDFLMNCNGRALAYKVYNAGYDVWLGNFRGNTYGRNHTSISADSQAFWEFKTDDMIKYDVPAAIDYILNATGQKKLNWIGFSLGNTVLFGLLASQPEYNSKIKLAVAIGGPAVYFNSTRSVPVMSLARNPVSFEKFVFRAFRGEVPPASVASGLHSNTPAICYREARRHRPGICSKILGFIDGADVAQVNWAMLPFIFGGMPSPTSARVVSQWLQWIGGGNFTKYDFGKDDNVKNYGQPLPPKYDLSKVTAPFQVFRADNDFLTPKEDIERAIRELPNIVENIHVDWPSWNHLDYLYGRNADVLVYDHILRRLDKYNKPSLTYSMP